MRAVWIPANTPALGGDVRASFDEDAVFSAPALPEAYGEMFVMNVSPLLRELILHACKFKILKQAGHGGTADYRNYRRSVEGRGFYPAAAARIRRTRGRCAW